MSLIENVRFSVRNIVKGDMRRNDDGDWYRVSHNEWEIVKDHPDFGDQGPNYTRQGARVRKITYPNEHPLRRPPGQNPYLEYEDSVQVTSDAHRGNLPIWGISRDSLAGPLQDSHLFTLGQRVRGYGAYALIAGSASELVGVFVSHSFN